MNQENTIIETIGYIKKEESLVTVENNILSNTLVLESLHPFPGYHGNLPNKSRPNSLFLVTSKDYSFEEIARVTNKIKETFKNEFDAKQGHIHFKAETLSCIRINRLKSFAFISELQNLFANFDIKLAKQKSINSDGIIVINKHFFINEYEKGIYRDLVNESQSYFEIPTKLSWETFKDYTVNIKYNIDNNNFDAAQGAFYRKTGIVDLVRIYEEEKSSIERIKTIQRAYLEEIRKNS